MATDNETIEYDIRIEAILALKNLADLTASVAGFRQKIQETSTFIRSISQQWGVPFKQVKSELQSLDAALSKNAASSTVFGGAGQAAWNQVGESAAKAEQKVSQSSKGIVGHIDAIRIAAGILVSMLVHQLLQAFTQVFTQAITNLREAELAVYNLINAEKRLSEQGIDVTPKGLQETIDKVRELVPILSKIQAGELVSRIATNVAPAVRFDSTQIQQMSEAIALLYVRNKALGKSFEEVESQVTNAFLTGKVSQGINNLGVKINDQIVKDEALRLGLVKTAEEFDNLTGAIESQIKAQAMLSIIYQNAQQDIGSLDEYMGTADANIERFKKAWSDLLTTGMEIFGPLVAKGFEVLANALEIVVRLLEAAKPLLEYFVSRMVALIDTTRNMPQYFKFGGGKLFAENFKENVAKAEGRFKSLSDQADTATGIGGLSSSVKAAQKHEEDLTRIFQEARDKRIDIDRNYQNKLQDLALDNSRKLEDIARKQAQQISDANRDYAEKVSDINRDAEQQEQDARADANRRSVEIERKYQEELKNLREKYLLDLEDALHERDARQILHLMRQYEIDKKHAQEERSTEQKRSQEQLQLKLKDIEQNRKLKLEEAKRDLENKIKDIKLSAARERQEAAINYNRQLADARLAHQRALEEQRLYLQKKLKDLADALAKEYNMTASQLQALQALYTGMGIVTNNATGSPYSPASINAGTYTPPPNSGFSGSGLYGTTGLAQGGSYLARTPHSINVAEQGPELIQATPLNRIGSDINKLFAQAGSTGGESMTGQLEIGVTLSPDLEARVISKTLNKTADVILKVNRSKV